jgi:4'-phosphopantetheinyl transferase
MPAKHQTSSWGRANPHPFLADGELHVWQASLDLRADHLAGLARLLSLDERERAARFRYERDRRRFMGGRGILRSILGRYLECAPAELSFSYGWRAKPFLPGTTLQFNLAHSDILAVLAVARSGAVGVDVERVRPVPDCDRIIHSFFSSVEIKAISTLPPAERLRGFFTCWTRKEAYVKARGDGITTQLDRFSVPVVPGSPPRLLHVEGTPEAETHWSFHDVPLGPDYLGVVAFEGAIRTVRYYLWENS